MLKRKQEQRRIMRFHCMKNDGTFGAIDDLTITYDGNQVTVADNGSSYGTFVGGQKVEPGKPMVMHRGQEVTFGSDSNSAALH